LQNQKNERRNKTDKNSAYCANNYIIKSTCRTLSIFALFVLFYYFWQAVIIGCITMVLLQIWAEKTEVGVKYSFLFILICWAFESSL
jgi:hypothetical protein